MPEWIAAAVAWVPTLVARWTPSAPTCTCVFEGPRVQPELLELLSRQLDRCGPANLTVPRCADCPALPPDQSRQFLLAGVLVGFCLGVVSTLLYHLLPASAPAPAVAPPAPGHSLPPPGLALPALAPTPAPWLALEGTPASVGRRRAPAASTAALRDQ